MSDAIRRFRDDVAASMDRLADLPVMAPRQPFVGPRNRPGVLANWRAEVAWTTAILAEAKYRPRRGTCGCSATINGVACLTACYPHDQSGYHRPMREIVGAEVRPC